MWFGVAGRIHSPSGRTTRSACGTCRLGDLSVVFRLVRAVGLEPHLNPYPGFHRPGAGTSKNRLRIRTHWQKSYGSRSQMPMQFSSRRGRARTTPATRWVFRKQTRFGHVLLLPPGRPEKVRPGIDGKERQTRPKTLGRDGPARARMRSEFILPVRALRFGRGPRRRCLKKRGARDHSRPW